MEAWSPRGSFRTALALSRSGCAMPMPCARADPTPCPTTLATWRAGCRLERPSGSYVVTSYYALVTARLVDVASGIVLSSWDKRIPLGYARLRSLRDGAGVDPRRPWLLRLLLRSLAGRVPNPGQDRAGNQSPPETRRPIAFDGVIAIIMVIGGPVIARSRSAPDCIHQGDRRQQITLQRRR